MTAKLILITGATGYVGGRLLPLYYLVHSMGATGDFEEQDRLAADNFASAAAAAGVHGTTDCPMSTPAPDSMRPARRWLALGGWVLLCFAAP